jgi:hypothetical protein
MTKRRFIEQLPNRLRTEDLKKFFSATVDHLFQPGQAEPISGYIGRYPDHYDVERDFYISEPTRARSLRQLEPVMTTTSDIAIARANSNTMISRVLFYDDLVAHISSQGGLVDNVSRLFDSEYYSWAPPVDIGKLTSPQNYYWFGDDPTALPGLLLSPAMMVQSGNNTRFEFDMPPTVGGLTLEDEAPAVWVNGVRANVIGRTENTVSIDFSPVSGDRVEIYRYGDINHAMTNKVSFDPSEFLGASLYFKIIRDRATFPTPAVVAGYERQEADISVHVNGVELPRSAYRFIEWSAELFVVLNSSAPIDSIVRITRRHHDPLTEVVSGMRVVLNDARSRAAGFAAAPHDIDAWDEFENNTFIVDGVGSAIELSDFDLIPHPEALYTVIDRRSKDRNPWSRSNMWVHRDAFRWANIIFPNRVAKRPIIEFLPDIELRNYGRRYIGAVTRVLTGPGNAIVGFDTDEHDTTGFEFGALESAIQINGRASGSVMVDDNLPLTIGDRLLIRNAVEGRDDLSHTVVRVVEALNGDGGIVMALEPEDDVRVGDIVSVGSTHRAYYHNGDDWLLAQDIAPGVAPQFALYDLSHTSLDDAGFYPDTDFVGSPLFGFAQGTGSKVDPILNRVLRYDALGQIVFENHLTTEKVTYRDGTVGGIKFYRVFGETPADDSYSTDWHPVSDPLRILGDEVPANLQANPDNEVIEFISKNEWLDHFKAIIENQEGFAGDAFGSNNWHNTARKLSVSGSTPLKILQHKSPLLKLMLIASDTSFDYLEAARYAEQEYARFRSRFVHGVINAYMDGTILDNHTGEEILSVILQSMKSNKTAEFPFAISTLGDPSGKETFFIPPTPSALGLLPCTTPLREVDHSFSSPVSFLRGHDGSRMPLFSDTVHFTADGAQMQFVLPTEPAGSATVLVNGNSVSFSLAGKVITLNSSPPNGASVEVRINDVRDRAMMALEQAIYQSIPPKFRGEEYRGFELTSAWVDGCYRFSGEVGYTLDEFTRIITPMFLRWAQKNSLDYRAHDAYEQSDPFSWNYNSTLDRYGRNVPGNWRGIYRWYFDTDRPHIAPWEMLGFSEKPSWWEDEYGAAPYTSGNTKLWEHLRDGFIAQGPLQGNDERFARPDLIEVLPVDDLGDLIDPVAANIIPNPPTFHQASRNWVFGDNGPVEHLWKMSPAYPFALSQAAYLMKPARFVEQCWDTLDTDTINKQWVHVPSSSRLRNRDLFVHGERFETGIRRNITGIQQWISERLTSLGTDPVVLGTAVRQLGVHLGHKMAGFTTSENLRVVADNFGLVPQEDVNVYLYASPSIRQDFYSGVIVEWSGTGWRVFGYDALNPSFSVEHGDSSGEKVVVSISNVPEVVILKWKPNVHYNANVLVEISGSVYECLRPHTSTGTFEQNYWVARPNVRRPEAPRVFKYLVGTGEETIVPYGTEFVTYQELADFLFGYERYLLRRGWVFDTSDDSGPFDWSRSMRDFLEWASVQWEPGNFIALSPGALGLKYVTEHGMVYSLEQAFSGVYGIVNREGMPIGRRDTVVSRIDGEVTIKTRDDDLFGVRLNVGEVEHALVFSNSTIFGDTIYKPLFDLRQPRLRVIGHRALDWNGRFDAPGYIISPEGIISNFDRAAEDIRGAFDIEGAGSKSLRDHARHLVGYESRSYLRALLLSETQQFEFYQGLIQQKGSAGTFGKMLRSQFIEQDRNLRFLEEWAFKSSTYGALDTTKRYSFDLWQSHIQRNPQLIRFNTREIDNSNSDVHNVSFSDFISGADNLPHVFPVRESYAAKEGDYPNAGYARLDEVHYTTFDSSTLRALYVAAAAETGHAFASGERIWVYNGVGHEWQVLRSTNLRPNGGNNRVLRIEISDDGSHFGARVVLEHPHGLVETDRGKFIVIDGETRTKTDIWGVQRVYHFSPPGGDEAGHHWVEIEASAKTGYRWIAQNDDRYEVTQLPTADDPENAPLVRVLRNVRFKTLNDLHAATWFQPVDGELAYIDTNPGSEDDPRWVVRMAADGSWTRTARIQPRKVDSSAIVASLVYDTTSQITKTRLLSQPLVIDRLVVVDPIGGLIPGEAERELTYKLEYDPARYNRGSAAAETAWGAAQIGELWWDLSAVRFINPETDEPEGTDRINAEQNYRVNNWGKIAPGTSVDVYEWTRSLVSPPQYQGEGVVLNPNNPSWVESEEFDSVLSRLVPVYYFWVKDKRTVSSLAKDRRLDARTVSRIIANSTSLDMPWISPTFSDGLMVGGVSQFLSDNTTVLQMDVRLLAGEGEVHHEWTLLRPQDSRSQPTPPLWNKMIDSLAGVDRFKRQVPDPRLNRHASQGIEIRPRQSLFGGTDDPRQTLWAARESMIGMINRIFAREDFVRQRVAPVQRLLGLADYFPTRNETETSPAVLAWSSRDALECGLPSRFEYDIEVFSLDERNDLLLSAEFENARSRGMKRRVLVNGLESAIPFWSVWEYDPATDGFGDDDALRYESADDLFVLAPAYDVKVTSRSERNSLDIAIGAVVLVQTDASASGFWTLWRYDPNHFAADAEGFTLLRAQDFRSSDFIEVVDWYADGYGPERPPVVSFANRLARDTAMGTNPSSTFVMVEDDGAEANSGWMWSVFEDGQWKTVALEKRTLRIKDELFTRLTESPDTTGYATGIASDTVLDWDTIGWEVSSWEGQPLARHRLTNIPRREGALEVRAILNALVGEVFNDDETNELFFSLVHFAHSHLDQVNWAFKTSFLYIGGYNEALVQSPIQRADNTENLLSYIEEVKPYRVKTRDFARGLAPPIEIGNLEATDFDKPYYFDPVLRRYRRLDPTVGADIAILSTGPYRRWYENHLKSGYDLDNYSPSTWNPIRRLKTTVMFDRVDGWVTADGSRFYPSFTHRNSTGTIGSYIINSTFPFSEHVVPGLLVSGAGVASGAVVKSVTPNSITVTAPHFAIVHGQLTFSYNHAARRIEDHYVAKFPGQREKNLEALLKLDFKGVITDGNGDALSNDVLVEGNSEDIDGLYLINPTVDGVVSLGLNDPKTAENRPEELVLAGNQDYVAFNVHSIGRPGSLYQSNKFFDVSWATGDTVMLNYSDLAQSNDGLAVFRDGVRADPSTGDQLRDYVIDQFKREIEISLIHADGSRVNRISVHIFGVGGLTRILEQRFYTFGAGDSQTLFVTPRDGDVVVEAFINGEPVPAIADFATGEVTLAVIIEEGEDVLLNVRESTGTSAAPEIRVMVEELPYRADGQWQLSHWHTSRPDSHAAAIVELDGIRLMPPETKYLRVGSGYRWALIDNFPLTGSDFDFVGFDDGEYDYATADRLLWNIHVGDEEYLGDVPDVSGLFNSPEEVVEGSFFNEEQFAYWRGYIVCVDVEILIDEVVIVINEGHDYTISRDGVLSLVNPPSDTGEPRVRVTTFTHVDNLGIETWTYKGRADGSYPIYRPHAGEYIWLTVNGKKQVFDVDFNLSVGSTLGDYDSTTGFDTAEWDNGNAFAATAGDWDLYGWDDPSQDYDIPPVPEPIVLFTNGHLKEDEIVITVFKKAPLRLPSTFLASSIVPGKSIMQAIKSGGWDASWDEAPLEDEAPVWVETPYGPRTIYSMEGGWEYNWVRQGHTGYLLGGLAAGATSVTIRLPDYSLDLFSDPWFVRPQPDAPGVVWVNGERIEYSGIDETIAGQVTLTGIVRSTKGTSLGEHPDGCEVFAATLPFTPRNRAL